MRRDFPLKQSFKAATVLDRSTRRRSPARIPYARVEKNVNPAERSTDAANTGSAAIASCTKLLPPKLIVVFFALED